MSGHTHLCHMAVLNVPIPTCLHAYTCMSIRLWRASTHVHARFCEHVHHGHMSTHTHSHTHQHRTRAGACTLVLMLMLMRTHTSSA